MVGGGNHSIEEVVGGESGHEACQKGNSVIEELSHDIVNDDHSQQTDDDRHKGRRHLHTLFCMLAQSDA